MVFRRYFEMPIFNLVFLALVASATTFFMLKGCGTKEKVVYIGGEQAPTPVAKTCADGSPLGTTRTLQCAEGEQGKILEACAESGWVVADNTCAVIQEQCEENAVTFEKDILPIIEDYCLGCHITPEPYNDYEVAKRKMLSNDNIIDRLESTDVRERMPQGKAPLKPEVVQIFRDWEDGGLLKSDECADNDSSGNAFLFMDLDYVETKILSDLERLDSNDRKNSMYLALAHKYNQRTSSEDMKIYLNGIVKTLNSLSLNEAVAMPTQVDIRGGVYRLNLEDYNLDADPRFGQRLNALGEAVSKDGWDLVLDFEPFKFESFTTKGLLIKGLTGKNISWLHADNFSFTSMSEPDVYYTALNVAATQDEFFAQLGLIAADEFNDFNVKLIGGFGSPISLNKNRLLSRFTTERSELGVEGGYLWFTYDPIDVDGVRERNLFEFPFPLGEPNSDLIFDHAAGEGIFIMPNGLQGYVLFAADGTRQDAAPLDVVIDVDSPFSPEIGVAKSCFRCHVKGLIPMQDQILDHVKANPTEFGRDDIDLVKAYYPEATTIAAQFIADINTYKDNSEAFGISVTDEEPITFMGDNHQKDWDLAEFCGFILLKVADCRQLITESAVVSQQIGQLSEGGTTGFKQIIDSFPQVILDFRLGQEDIDQ